MVSDALIIRAMEGAFIVGGESMSSRHPHVNKAINDRFRERQAAKGLIRVEVRIPASRREYILALARELRDAHERGVGEVKQ